MIRRPMFLALLLLFPSSCGDEGGLESSNTACSDKRDNDGDGKVDCDDSECREFPFCQQTLSNQSCGDGVVGSGETCDTGIASGVGACPTECDDGIACTFETLENPNTCVAECTADPITQCVDGDGCCPSGCDGNNDNDCSLTCGNGALEPGEGCDTKIVAGEPGACPSDCDDGNACTKDQLLGDGTCDASCSYEFISACSMTSDGCCPKGCDAVSDADCSATCGNGLLELNEKCDTKILAGQPGACPTQCDDGIACTKDTLLNGGTCGAVCSASQITQCKDGDGCCPAGCTANNDKDCSPTCGNGALEVNETCDTKIPAGQPGACPTTCDDGSSCTIDQLLNGGTCGAVCSHKTVTTCLGKSDGCCPAGCDAVSDADCSPTCGNGVLEPNETCDTKIPAGSTGACPIGCDDGTACTIDELQGAGTCSALCSHKTITACSGKTSDGCCPAGCNANNDGDCSPSCGNGVVEANEKCDTKISAGVSGACPIQCNDQIACTIDQLLGAGTCDAECQHTAITSCSGQGSDKCCPAGCNANNDSDCSSSCGNGVLEPGEKCDIKIPAGQKGACPTSCDDGKPCTFDSLLNGGGCDAVCAHKPVTACSVLKSDGCCPAGCNANTDADCKPVCGNGVLEKGELCDVKIPSGYKGACPSSCDDGKACTKDTLSGTGCQAKCTFTAITTCSVSASDGCCPPGCNANNDADCKPVCGNGVLEKGETCDIKIPSGYKGACPTACLSTKCQKTSLDYPGTCQAKCTSTPITTCSTTKDGCCPSGCNANNDADCTPKCGNGVVESGETCDTAIPVGVKGACPTLCLKKPCYNVSLQGAGTCQATCKYTAVLCLTKDKCLINKGCDPKTGKCVFLSKVCNDGNNCTNDTCNKLTGACVYTPKCDDKNACTNDYCKDGQCYYKPVACSVSGSDGCCPSGCNANNDADCTPVCGNGVVESGETCDTKIPVGVAGACPTACFAKKCTTSSLLDAGKCTARCVYKAITVCSLDKNDGCCPAGCNANNDVNCAPECGNGVLEKGEICDIKIPAGQKGACPTSCLKKPCYTVSLLDQGTCLARCSYKYICGIAPIP